MNTRGSVEDTARFLALLARPGDVFELRALTKGRSTPLVHAGYFDDMAMLAQAAMARSGNDDGVYITLNPVNPALLARAPKNRIRQAGNGDTTSDRDVRARSHLLVDVDPARPTGISSTDEEHAAAIELATRVADELAGNGWPEPIVADSGNGGHLIYAIDLPVDDGGLIKRVLAALSAKYTTPELKVDEKVFNPARISKIYGTLTRKGENTAERPHRISRILRAPAELAAVSREQLEAIAPATPTPTRSTPPRPYQGPSAPTFSIDEWMAEHLPDAIQQPWSEGRKWLLPICPFNSDHNRREAYVVEKHSGMIAAACQHESCFKSWQQLRTHFEPAAYDRRRQSNGSRHAAATVDHTHGERQAPRPEPEVVCEDPRYEDEINAFASRDRDETPAAPKPTTKAAPRPKWFRAPELVDEIMRFANEPWIGLTLGEEEIVRVRAGGIAVVMGGSGSGKSSFVTGLMIQHARQIGPAINLSLELPADEFGGRAIGMQCEASWEETLRGQVRREFMVDALAIPRLWVIDRKNATFAVLQEAIDAARAEFKNEPILVGVDYAQLVQSTERETRQKVNDVFVRIDDLAREKRVVVLAVSQMSRNAAKQARDGEKLGAESADGGAESAAIERFATVTLAIGQAGPDRQDGSKAVELSIGKGRMTGGDRVLPMSYVGRTGRWRVAGEAKRADDVRAERKNDNDAQKQKRTELAMIGAATQANEPVSREDLEEMVGKMSFKRAAIACLVARGDLVEVQRKKPRAKAWLLWTAKRAAEAGIPLVCDLEDGR